jgi:hypothetical protein
MVTFPQILLNAFMSGSVEPGCINLLVFDECQKVAGNPHVYGEILEIINQLNEETRRPLLLGLLPCSIYDTHIEHRVHADLIRRIEARMNATVNFNVADATGLKIPTPRQTLIKFLPENDLDIYFQDKTRSLQRTIDYFVVFYKNAEQKEVISDGLQFLLESVKEWRFIASELGLLGAFIHGEQIVYWLNNNSASLYYGSTHRTDVYQQRIEYIQKSVGTFQ